MTRSASTRPKDGKPFMRAQGVELHMAPVGLLFLGMVQAGTPGSSLIWFLTAGNRRLPGSDCNGGGRYKDFRFNGNPVVGYSGRKDCVRLLFWSGQSFRTSGLAPEGKFKAAEARYTSAEQGDTTRLRMWLSESREIPWDYQNIVRRKGRLERLK